MIPLSAKLAMTFVLSATAVALFIWLGGKYRKQCMIAMLLSTCGDLFMVDDFIPLGDYGTYIGAAFFIAAHIVYGLCFRQMSRQSGYKTNCLGLYLGIAVMAASTIVLTVFNFLAAEPAIIMFVLILVYIAVIGFHLVENFVFSFSARGISYILAFAVLIFYLSDVFIFLNMLGISDALRDYVWFVYPVAQLLLIVFNSPLRRVRAVKTVD